MEVLTTGGGQLVELRPPVVVGGPPLGDDPAFLLEALQSGVERSVVDAKLRGRAFDRLRNAVPVGGSPDKRSEHEHVERALDEIEAVGVGSCVRHLW